MSLYPIVILAGGLATRIRPITEQIPKALVEVGGEPFIAHQLRLISARGIKNVIISAWYLGEMIQEYLGNGSEFGLQVQYVFDGKKALGTAGAIRNTLNLLESPFFVLNGDTYFPCDYAAIQAFYDAHSHAGLMTVNYNQMDWHESNVELRDGIIIRHQKQNQDPLMKHVDAGLALFDPQVFMHIPDGQYADMMDVFQKLLAEDNLIGYEEKQRFYEMGSFSGLKELDALLGENPNQFL